MTESKRIMLVVGETSGDNLTAQLVNQVRTVNPNVNFTGVGGPKMRQAGVDLLIDSTQLSCTGFIQPLIRLPYFYKMFKQLEKILKNNPPDLLVLVDFPSFNLRLAKVAKKAGVKILYYVSPQVWAWATWRVKQIRKNIDIMAVIFPFEETFYQQHNVSATFVGHPLLEHAKMSNSKAAICELLTLDPNKRILGLLPGSRRGEAQQLLPIILAAAKQLKAKYPDLQFVLPIAPSLSKQTIQAEIQKYNLDVNIVHDHFYDVLGICDAAIITSGTATFQAGLMQTPNVIIYKASFITYLLARLLSKVDFLGICNIIAGKPIVKEFLQYDATAKNLTNEISRLFEDKSYYDNMKQELLEVREKLSESNVKTTVSQLVNQLIN